jgi:signal transduction histidine kinase
MERMRVGIHRRDEQLRLMLAQVAHEIRNPLGGLELFAAAAADAKDPEERLHVLKKVRAEVLALNQIIDDFLVFARPMEPEVEAHDVSYPVREAVELIRPVVESEGGEVSLDLPKAPLMAHADPDHVKRLVLNLLRNASQAGQKVGVRAELLDGEVRISVRDNGPGVDPTVRERIFEPFVTDKAQGAGLGLAIVRRVAEVNGGRVELAEAGGEYGEGAEFRVYFTNAEETPAETE